MLDAIEYHTVDFIPLSESPYFGAPTDELEQAWDADWQCKLILAVTSHLFFRFNLFIMVVDGAMGIPVEHLTLLNKTVTERAWHHVPAELGGGIQAMFEGFHYIHCLVSYKPFTISKMSRVGQDVNPSVTCPLAEPGSSVQLPLRTRLLIHPCLCKPTYQDSRAHRTLP